jgi:hypothetical protein
LPSCFVLQRNPFGRFATFLPLSREAGRQQTILK